MLSKNIPHPFESNLSHRKELHMNDFSCPYLNKICHTHAQCHECPKSADIRVEIHTDCYKVVLPNTNLKDMFSNKERFDLYILNMVAKILTIENYTIPEIMNIFKRIGVDEKGTIIND